MIMRKIHIKIILFLMIMFVPLLSGDNEHVEDDEIFADANALIVKLPYFAVKILGFYGAEEDVTPEGYEEFNTDKSDILDDITLNYLLWDFMGPFGDIFEADLIIVPEKRDFGIIRIEQQYSTDVLFNEDGSGGVWSIGGVEGMSSEWMEIEEIESNYYKTLSEKALATTKPDVSEESIEHANKYIGSREIPTTYDEYVSNVQIRITWEAESDTFETILNFDMEYGD